MEILIWVVDGAPLKGYIWCIYYVVYGREYMVYGWFSKLGALLGVHIKGDIDIDVDIDTDS